MMYIEKHVDIEKLPNLPEEIIEAYNQKKLVVFVGAGISRLVGCKGWDELANNLIHVSCDPITEDQIKSRYIGSKEKITIAKRYAQKDNKIEEKFWKEFQNALLPKKEYVDIYRSIASLNTIYVTTNCDGLLVEKFPYNYTTECTQENFRKHAYGNNPYVFCIHGNYGKGTEEEKKTLVFTTDEYLKAYQSNKELPQFLKQVMSERNVLFLGYGLGEFEILNSVFESVEGGGYRHFVLEGYFTYQQALCDAMAEYYSSVGIKLIAYSKDEKGFDQQYDVIGGWINELKNKTIYNMKGIQQVDDALNVFSERNQETVRRLLERSDSLGESYHKKVMNDIPTLSYWWEWLCFLLDGVDSYTSFPRVKERGDTIEQPGWEILFCIKKCRALNKWTTDQLDYIHCFLSKCIEDIVCDPLKLKNINAIDSMIDVLFDVNYVPDTQNDKILYHQWLDQGPYISHSFYDNMESMKAWEKEFLQSFFVWFFIPENDSIRKYRGFMYSRIAEKMVSIFSDEFVFDVVINLVEYLCGMDEKVSFYERFEERYKYSKNSFDNSLLKVVEVLSGHLCLEYRNRICECMFASIHNTYSGQLAFYLAKRLQAGSIEMIHETPFKYRSIFEDFYLWMEERIEGGAISISDTEKIVVWVKNSTFGYTTDHDQNEEQKDHIRKYGNSLRHLIYLLITKVNQEASILVNSISESDRYDIRPPKNDLKNASADEIFMNDNLVLKEELSNQDEDDIIQLAIERIDEAEESTWRYKIENTIKLVFSSISKEGISKFLNKATQLSYSKVTVLLSLWHREIFNNKWDGNMTLKYISDIYNRLAQDLVSSDSRKVLINEIIYVLEELEEDVHLLSDLFEFLSHIDRNVFFSDAEVFNEEMDTVMNVLNIPECRFYSLLIELVLNMADTKEGNEQCKSHLHMIIQTVDSKWLNLSLTKNIGKISKIDSTWIENEIIPKLSADHHIERIVLSLCYWNSIIYPWIVNFCIESDLLHRTALYIEAHPEEKTLVDGWITYMGAARYYDYLSDGNYKDFIQEVTSENVNQLIWTILDGITNADRERSLKLLQDTIFMYQETHRDMEEISRAVIVYLSFKENLELTEWNILRDAFVKSNHSYSLWEYLCCCIENSKKPNDIIGQVITDMCEWGEPPFQRTIENIIDEFDRLNMEKEREKVVNYALNNKMVPRQLNKEV